MGHKKPIDHTKKAQNNNNNNNNNNSDPNADFWKFPKTDHIEGSSVVDDDNSVPINALQNLFKEKPSLTLSIQEKVDGANVGVHFQEEWQPLIQKRGGLVGSSEKPQYGVFRNWVFENMEELYTILTNKYVMFGEWLWCQHSVGYNALPSFFICFDILEKSTGKFLAGSKVKAMLKDKTIVYVPELYRGSLPADLDKLIHSLITQSKFGAETAEGVYLRVEDNDYVIERVKYRRKTFECGRDNFDTKIVNNSLKEDQK